MGVISGKDHRGSNYWSGKASSPGLITTRFDIRIGKDSPQDFFHKQITMGF
jgi:hypothetical protein